MKIGGVYKNIWTSCGDHEYKRHKSVSLSSDTIFTQTTSNLVYIQKFSSTWKGGMKSKKFTKYYTMYFMGDEILFMQRVEYSEKIIILHTGLS